MSEIEGQKNSGHLQIIPESADKSETPIIQIRKEFRAGQNSFFKKSDHHSVFCGTESPNNKTAKTHPGKVLSKALMQRRLSKVINKMQLF